jgi:hypothetical protein
VAESGAGANSDSFGQKQHDTTERRAGPRPKPIPNVEGVLRRGPTPSFVAHLVGAYLLPHSERLSRTPDVDAYTDRNRTGRFISVSA